MIQAFRDLHDLHRVFVAGSGLLEKTTGVPNCIPGCGKCCQQNTPVCMALEALNMVSALLGRTLHTAVEEAEGWLLESHGLKIFRGVPTGAIPKDLMEEWAFASKLQCAFLKENQSCGIYQQRPLTCRTYGVYRDSFGMDCPRPLGKGETPGRHAVIESSAVRPVVEELRHEWATRNPAWTISGFAPTLLFRAAKPDKMKEYIAENKIASAKLIGVNINVDLMWQPQLNALRKGLAPDLALLAT